MEGREGDGLGARCCGMGERKGERENHGGCKLPFLPTKARGEASALRSFSVSPHLQERR